MKGSESTINGLWYVPITTSEDVNPNKTVETPRERSEIKKEAANGTPKVDLGFQSATTAECGIAKCWNTSTPVQIKNNTPILPKLHLSMNATTPTPTYSQAELAMYHHQLLGNPPKDTLLRALRKHPTQFETFPGLTYELISTHLPPSKAT